MTVGRYRLVDLGIFALLLCLLEAACAFALGFFQGEAYTLSLTLFVSLLLMMRWGWPGILHAVLGGGIYCLLHGGTALQYAIYMAGGAAIAVNLLWFRFLGAKKVRDSALFSVLYCVTGHIALSLGRAVTAAILAGAEFIPALVRFFSVDTLSAIFTVIFILIARKQNGLFEPQRDYLSRLAREEEERKRGTD